MKILALLTLLFSLSAKAAEKHEELVFTSSIQVMNNLVCIMPAGTGDANHRVYTQLGSESGTSLIAASKANGLELEHKVARVEACEMKKLDKIIEASLRHFGFVYATAVKLIKDTSESRKNGFGQCVANYDETLIINLGNGIVLKSEASQLRSMNDCHE